MGDLLLGLGELVLNLGHEAIHDDEDRRRRVRDRLLHSAREAFEPGPRPDERAPSDGEL